MKQLQSSFTTLNYKHTFQKNNIDAHSLSKTALKKKAGIITYNLWVEGHEGPTHVLKLF
jgi:hypothetical protein